MIEQVEIQAEGRKLVADYFTCNGKREQVVILLHGFLASKESSYAAADSLKDEGIDAIAIDFNGHGNSEGDFSDFTIARAIEDFKVAVEFAKSKGYTKIGVFGFSLGGFVALCALNNKPMGICTAVLGAPVSDFNETFGTADMGEWKENNLFKSKPLGISIRLNYAFYTEGLEYTDFSRISVPILVIHGTEDDMVPIAQSVALTKKVKDVHLLELDGASHNIFSNGHGPITGSTLAKWFKSKMQ